MDSGCNNSGKLKIGIILNSFQIPAWIYHSLSQIISSKYAEISLVMINESLRYPKEKSSIVYQIFNKIDERIFIKTKSAISSMNSESLLASIPILKKMLIEEDKTILFDEKDINEIMKYGLDVLVNIGSEILQGNIYSAAKYGIWAYQFEDYPHGLWEVVEGRAETNDVFLILYEGLKNRRVLYSSSSLTYPFSPARNRNCSLWKSSSFLARQLALLYSLGEKKFFIETEKYHKNINQQFFKHPQLLQSNIYSFYLIFKQLIRNIREAFSRFFYFDTWFLLFNLGSDDLKPIKEFKKITPPKAQFWADPQIIKENGTYYIFVEEFLREKNIGRISVIAMDKLGNCTPPEMVLDKDYHLSYPFILTWEERYYMVPESRSNKTIDLYECTEFPYKWVFKHNLMKNVSAVDSTLVNYSDKWWLFTAMAENMESAPSVELFLFYSDDLFSGEWKAHPKNPIITDARNARPAGNIYFKNGKLIRPSQNCSKGYGYGIELNEIDVMSETEYYERKIISIKPEWDIKITATHTFAYCEGLTVIDAFTRVPKNKIKRLSQYLS